MAKDKIFLDSSIIISALLSSRGGSFYILYYLTDIFEFQINKYVFDEVMGVLDKKFANKPQLKNKFFALISLTSIRIFPDPPKKDTKILEKFINKEDTPILASALKNSSYLLTLDNHFLVKVVLEFTANKNLSILKPKEFIQNFRQL